MALFDIFRGTEEELMRKKLHAGYAYFCEDTGKFFIDISDGEDGTETDLYRIPINSKAANGLLRDDNYIEADSFATLEDIDSVTSKAYSATLIASQWSKDGDKWRYCYRNRDIKCGSEGNIPPLIACTSGEKDYALIAGAEATSGVGIDFWAEGKPSGDISITVTDIG